MLFRSQLAPRDTCQDLKGERSPLLPLETRPDSPCETGMQPRVPVAPGEDPWGFPRQEYWCVLPCCPPRDLPNSGTEPRSPALQVDPLLSEPPGKPMLQCYKFCDLFIWVINCNRIETPSVFAIIYSQCQAQKLADRCSINIC